VLIAEGENPVSLVILRSLRMKDVDAVVLASFSRCFSRFSRYCNQMILVPSMARMKEYAKAVEKIVKKMKFNVFFPVFDWSLIPVSQNRDKISSYVKLPIASHESILKCFDKLSTMKLAIENDVPIPQTYFVHNSAELKKTSKEITYPAVVKPRWSIIWKNDRAFHRRGGFVNSAAELVATYNNIHQYFPFPLVQEYVPGVNYSVAALYNEGRPRAFCCVKVPRAWPPTGGNSCFRESVPLDSEMRKYSETLLNALDWHGIAEVEFRVDSRDNVPRLMEINPRFWGSLSVAVKAGVDLPYLLYRMTMDGDVKGVFNYKVGVKGRYFEQDLLYIISLFKDSSPTSGVWNRKKLKVLGDWLKFYESGLFYDMFEVDDPLPFLFSSVSFPLGLLKFLREKSYAWSPPRVRF
jgi:predicted ATP-grasp superfamily ATP-dependent carboligase